MWDTASGEAFCFLKPGPSFASGRGTARFDTGGISTRSRTAAEEDLAQEVRPQGQVPEVQGLSCCSFSPSGECFVSSCKSGITYMWSWQVMGSRTRRRGPRTREQTAAGIPDIDNEGPLDPENWPHPAELCILEGHQADVSLAFFNHNGCALATASRDGQVRVRTVPGPKIYTLHCETCIECLMGVDKPFFSTFFGTIDGSYLSLLNVRLLLIFVCLGCRFQLQTTRKTTRI